jgi:hypothetical protein
MVRPNHDRSPSWLGRFYLHNHFITSKQTNELKSEAARYLFDVCLMARTLGLF